MWYESQCLFFCFWTYADYLIWFDRNVWVYFLVPIDVNYQLANVATCNTPIGRVFHTNKQIYVRSITTSLWKTFQCGSISNLIQLWKQIHTFGMKNRGILLLQDKKIGSNQSHICSMRSACLCSQHNVRNVRNEIKTNLDTHSFGNVRRQNLIFILSNAITIIYEDFAFFFLFWSPYSTCSRHGEFSFVLLCLYLCHECDFLLPK